MGNIYAKRDWGYSLDYVEAMWKMLQQNKPDDFVISSGVNYTVKTFVNKVAEFLGFNLEWKGNGLNERAIDKKSKKVIVKIKKNLFRPIEIRSTFGNSSKAKKILKWEPKTDFNTLVQIMCNAELDKYR
ncbi:GDP-mannose 4,6-dehydratase [Pelagibacteraceae bacterium]|nr:GDP-mannose 4,6-dehydratase [Pelagibacteraceae bacterium]